MGDRANVLVGAPATFKFANYVTARAVASTYTDVGLTQDGVTIDPKIELHEVVVDQFLGKIAAIPKARDLEIKAKFAETSIENMRAALAQPAANITGTGALRYDASAGEQYYQIQIIGKGLQALGLRTITVWRAFVKDVGSWMFKKDANQAFDMTFGVCEETTGSTATKDTFLQVIET